MVAATMEVTKAITHPFCAFHVQPGMPRWHHCRRGHGFDGAVILDLACSREDLPDNGLLGDPETLRDFETWLEHHLGDLLGAHTLNDIVADGRMESLARWIWDQWHERIPELRAVIVDELIGAAADWPEGTSATATRIRANKRHREAMHEARPGIGLSTASHPLLEDMRLVDAITAWGRHYVDAGRWNRTSASAVDGPSWAPTWADQLAETVPEAADAERITEQVTAWLDACYEYGAALRSAGRIDDRAARERVWEAADHARELAESWMDLIEAATVIEI